MSTMTRNTSDTSVTFSLAELAKIEAERVREEDVHRTRAREREAKERREAAQLATAAEAAQLAATAEARARRLREEADERARLEVRQRAEMEVARIGAEARVRLDADNAQRAHELAMLKVRTEGGRRHLQIALAAVIGVALCGGAAVSYTGDQRVTRLAQDAERLREGQQAQAMERERADASELAALDRRFGALRARPQIKDAEEARRAAEAARKAADAKGVDPARLRAYGDALDALQGRLETLDRLGALDRRQADLGTWASERKRGEALAAARTAGVRARAMGTDEALRVYEGALDQVRDTLAQSAGGAGRQAVAAAAQPGGAKGTCLAGDPNCGLDGRTMF